MVGVVVGNRASSDGWTAATAVEKSRVRWKKGETLRNTVYGIRQTKFLACTICFSFPPSFTLFFQLSLFLLTFSPEEPASSASYLTDCRATTEAEL